MISNLCTIRITVLNCDDIFTTLPLWQSLSGLVRVPDCTLRGHHLKPLYSLSPSSIMFASLGKDSTIYTEKTIGIFVHIQLVYIYTLLYFLERAFSFATVYLHKGEVLKTFSMSGVMSSFPWTLTENAIMKLFVSICV